MPMHPPIKSPARNQSNVAILFFPFCRLFHRDARALVLFDILIVDRCALNGIVAKLLEQFVEVVLITAISDTKIRALAHKAVDLLGRAILHERVVGFEPRLALNPQGAKSCRETACLIALKVGLDMNIQNGHILYQLVDLLLKFS